MLLLFPVWALVSLVWALLVWLFPSQRVLGLAIAGTHLSLSASTVLWGVVSGPADGALPEWIIAPGVVSALIRVAVELSGTHGQRP
ncbi:hypothetical protein ACIQM4_28585 [Streptomyces sp. NPDC091272]|uniref:hypothetical protein n=1 Tax=Streptomyces sp. NPDC091272 TaxID=3365981 RepID=UPI0037FE7FBA